MTWSAEVAQVAQRTLASRRNLMYQNRILRRQQLQSDIRYRTGWVSTPPIGLFKTIFPVDP